MRIAITGGTGLVGGHLAVTLARAGHEVVIVARGVKAVFGGWFARDTAAEVLRMKTILEGERSR